MRVHFENFSFEEHWDFMYILDSNKRVVFRLSGLDLENFSSPWIQGNLFYLTYSSDDWFGSEFYGYNIDYVEYCNETDDLDLMIGGWDFYTYSTGGLFEYNYTRSFGVKENRSAIYLGIHGDDTGGASYVYYEDDYCIALQELNIPRGTVIDASLSFDYYLESGIEMNDLALFVQINRQDIFIRGFNTIHDLGAYSWQFTGPIEMNSWLNTTNIFNNKVYGQNINLSIGIVSVGTWSISAPNNTIQLMWLDNIEFELTTEVNATQTGLKINNKSVQNGENWGSGSLNLTGTWDQDPVKTSINVTSPIVSFDLDTTIYGSHNTTSTISQSTVNGTNLNALKNGTIEWEFFHYVYIPTLWLNYSFVIFKPLNWEIFEVFDGKGDKRVSYQYGGIGENNLTIPDSIASVPGYWRIILRSPNYINKTNTHILKDSKWVETAAYYKGDFVKIRTQINYSDEIPTNLGDTKANLTIIHPNGTVWWEESEIPNINNGSVKFSEIQVAYYNTTGGVYNYTIVWGNGTAFGVINSSFIITHNSSLTLLKPNDAIIDLTTEAFLGDLIPVRIYLKDSDNNFSISNSLLSFNWTTGTKYLEEAALGIYEAIIDTSDLGSNGVYEILINSTIVGFIDSNITLTINLAEETALQVLDSEFSIEMHANSNIRFKYFSDFDGEGINSTDGALIKINISNPNLYTISEIGEGVWNIEFSTTYINTLGVYKLKFNFSAPSFETQQYTFQFSIVEQLVDFIIKFESTTISENALVETNFNDVINISAKVKSILDNTYLSGGNVTWKSENFEKDLTEYGSYWFNTSIEVLSSRFSFGINYVYLEFQQPNYKTKTFAFQLLVDQIDIEVITIDIEGTIETLIGVDISIEIELRESGSSTQITDANVSYSWQFGLGTLEENENGTYILNLDVPANVEPGTYKITLIISKEGSIYKTTQSFVYVLISAGEEPDYLFWIIIIAALAVIAVLSALSVRSYILIPRRRKKESELLSRTQKIKDIMNIEAIVITHRGSGVPIFHQTYSILRPETSDIFSGFISAITQIAKEISGEREVVRAKEIFELNFQQFVCLIVDKGPLRLVLLLKEKSSERLKKICVAFLTELEFTLGGNFEDWLGDLDEYELKIPPILYKYMEMFYKGSFEITKDLGLMLKLKKNNVLGDLETRIINVMESILKLKKSVELDEITELISETNRDKILDSIEILVKNGVLIPSF